MQRLQWQATRFSVNQAFLKPRSPFWSALTAVKPWDSAKTVTYVLRQNGHGIARAGLLQAQRRPNRPEADILLLAPALDTRTGHPAIWEKLLAHYLNEAVQQQTQRIYADVPDQPLLESTFAHVGFRTYSRQTVWRLPGGALDGWTARGKNAVRPRTRTDEWGLIQLYARCTPDRVQLAEGAGATPEGRPPILDWCHGGESQQYVLASSGVVLGSVRVVVGDTGALLECWAEPGRSGSDEWAQLLGAGLSALTGRRKRLPVYVAVKEFQGGLAPVLADAGFAPFADHARMVRQTVQRVVGTESVRMSALEAIPEALTTFRPLPDATAPGSLPEHTLAHRRSRRQSPRRM
jgi:hypothetical protein